MHIIQDMKHILPFLLLVLPTLVNVASLLIQETMFLNRPSEQREGRRDDEGDDEDKLNSIRESDAVNRLPALEMENFRQPHISSNITLSVHITFTMECFLCKISNFFFINS